MRKKVRKSLAFLLALALVVSVMSGLGLSVSADDAQNEPVVTETEGEPAEEKLKAEESTPKEGEEEEEADPDAEAVPEEKKGVKKAEGEGSSEKAAENKDAATPKAGENVQTATIGSGDKTVTVKTTAAAGVLPEGAKLVVKKLANQDQAYQDAESTLKDSQVTEDDTYDLSLSVSGAKGTQTNPAKLDIVLVLDVSTSMDDKIQAVKTAANSFISTVGENEAISAQYKVITFGGQGGGNDTAAWLKTNGWVAADSAVKAVDGIQIGYNVGTNYEAGITLATNELGKNARSGAQKVVVFFSDGEPTFRSTYDRSTYDNGYGNGQNDYDGKNLNAAVNAAKKLTCDYFYCIGTGTAKLNNLRTLANAANATTKGAQTTSNVNQLTGIFKDIAAKITTFLCTNVIVTDVLSDNVQMVMGSNDEPKKLVVTVTDKDGNAVQMPESIITVGYDKAAKKIFMDFKDEYELNPNYTYTVTATIKATEKAYENYRNNGNKYNNTGDTDTGTASAGQKGVFSNKDGEAKVTYIYNEKRGEAEYPRPVIQLHPGTLIVEKKIQGDLTSEEKNALVNKMTVDVTINGDEVKVPLSKFTEGSGETYTMTIEGLSPNTTYSVTESGAEVEGYDLDAQGTMTTTETVGKGETKSVSITNNYTRAVQNLTITKVVSGNDKAFDLNVSGIDYTFTITPGKGVTVKDGKYGNATFSNNEGTVTIKGKSSVTIPDLPVGTYTVTETSRSSEPEGYDFDDSTVTTGTATLTSANAGEVTITNKYKIKELKVTVKKEVNGNMGDTNQEFSFNNGNFKLKNGQEKEFMVKYGEAFTVTETDANKNGYTTSYKVDDGDAKDGGTCTIEAIKANTTITFTNEKTIQPPNGIITTIAPYAIMVVLAAGAGVYFVYSRRRRNR